MNLLKRKSQRKSVEKTFCSSSNSWMKQASCTKKWRMITKWLFSRKEARKRGNRSSGAERPCIKMAPVEITASLRLWPNWSNQRRRLQRPRKRVRINSWLCLCFHRSSSQPRTKTARQALSVHPRGAPIRKPSSGKHSHPALKHWLVAAYFKIPFCICHLKRVEVSLRSLQQRTEGKLKASRPRPPATTRINYPIETNFKVRWKPKVMWIHRSARMPTIVRAFLATFR